VTYAEGIRLLKTLRKFANNFSSQANAWLDFGGTVIGILVVNVLASSV